MKEHRISRREWLRAGLITLGTVLPIVSIEDSLFAHLGAQTITLPFWERLETGSFRQNPETVTSSIEKKFGVVILPQDTIDNIYLLFPNYRKYTPEEIAQIIYLRTSWDLPRLACLNQTLDSVPTDFYQPQTTASVTRPLHFSLFNHSGTIFGEAGLYYTGETPEVRLITSYLPQTLPVQLASRKIIVHELTHHLTISVANNPDSSLQGATTRLKTAVGLRNIDELRNTFKSVIVEDPTGPRTNRLISWKTHLGYGANNLDEFWAVAAETYYEGREVFKQGYTEFLGKETTDDFYGAMKAELFSNYEYRQGIRII